MTDVIIGNSFTNPKNGPSGIEYVFVNGEKSVINGEVQKVFSGTTIKRWKNQKTKFSLEKFQNG